MPTPSTRLRVATVAQGNQCFRSAQENRDYVLGLADIAFGYGPDLLCLPEEFPAPNVSTLHPETIPGPTTDAVSERARKHNCYVICPLQNRREVDGAEVVSNSAVVIDRRGDILGIYDKRHPVTSSHDYTCMEAGVTPGVTDGIFDLDFGRVGIRICFDVGFREDWAGLAHAGARLVIWPSAYDGGDILSAYALLHGYWVVTSVRTERSRIIDPCGVTVAKTDKPLGVAVRDINLDFAVCHYDFNLSIPDRILAGYPGRVEIRSHVDAGMFMVEPVDPTVTTQELMLKYGFEPSTLYHQRHREAYDALLQGKSARPQTAAHGPERPMWQKW